MPLSSFGFLIASQLETGWKGDENLDGDSSHHSSVPPINLLASRLARRALLPEDFARRVSVNLHKCSAGEVIFEKAQS